MKRIVMEIVKVKSHILKEFWYHFDKVILSTAF